MHIVDISSIQPTVDSVDELLAETSGYWEHIYDTMDPSETLWVFASNRYDKTEYWSAPMLVADYLREETPFKLKNTILRHTDPEPGSGLQSIYETILFLVRDKREYRFNKDEIRVDHVYQGNEWTDRETGSSAYHDTEVQRYNAEGKDPGNVWLDEDRSRTDNETVDAIHPLPRTEAVKRCIRAGSQEGEIVRGLWLSDSFTDVIKDEGRRVEEMSVPDGSAASTYRPWVVETSTNESVTEHQTLELEDLRVLFQSSEDMSDVDEGSVQSIITSPPYWDLKDYGHEEQIGTADESYEKYHERMKRVWKECYDVLAPGGTMWVVVDTVMNRGDLRLLPQHIANNAVDIGFNHWDNIGWYKPTAIAGMTARNVVNKHEYIVALSKGTEFKLNATPDTENGAEDPAVQESGPLGNLFRHPVKRGTAGQNVLHKAPFPMSLIRRLVRLSTDPGDVILDPFLGSGTTAEAALDLNRTCIGYEINPEFEDLIEERVGQRSITDF